MLTSSRRERAVNLSTSEKHERAWRGNRPFWITGFSLLAYRFYELMDGPAQLFNS